MKLDFFLIVKENGSIRTTKYRPDLSFNEVAIAMNLDLPAQLFSRPLLKATMEIPESAVHKDNITVEMTDNILKAIEQAAGIEVKLTIEPKPE